MGKVVTTTTVAEGEEVSEPVVPKSVKVNGESLGITFDIYLHVKSILVYSLLHLIFEQKSILRIDDWVKDE